MADRNSDTEHGEADIGADVVVRRRTIIASWLYVVALMVFAMVIVGGLTRLTGSGLSMVEWQPLTGWLPPLDEAMWSTVFEKYKAYPEYQKINAGMTLLAFKNIFWLEYLHRLWGRVIGVAFLIPFVVFVAMGWVNWRLGFRLFGLFVLGGLQGVLGWYMVKSGLIDRPDVSQYRLAAHLSLALVIIVALLWTARGLNTVYRARWACLDPDRVIGLRWAALLVLLIVFGTACSGAFVAGTGAGLAYNTFPLMDGEWIPEGLFMMMPRYLNFFENTITVQFNHRVLATITALSVVVFWLAARRHDIPPSAVAAMNCLLLAVLGQVSLGIITLLKVAAVPYAAGHQTGGVVVLVCAAWVGRELTPPPTRI